MSEPGQLEVLLATYVDIGAHMGGKPQAAGPAYPEEQLFGNLRAMQNRQNVRFRSVLLALGAVFALVLVFSFTNHFSLEIAKIAIGSGGLISISSLLLLRNIWREATLIDLLLTTLPLVAQRERHGFILAVLASLREARARSQAQKPTAQPRSPRTV